MVAPLIAAGARMAGSARGGSAARGIQNIKTLNKGRRASKALRDTEDEADEITAAEVLRPFTAVGPLKNVHRLQTAMNLQRKLNKKTGGLVADSVVPHGSAMHRARKQLSQDDRNLAYRSDDVGSDEYRSVSKNVNTRKSSNNLAPRTRAGAQTLRRRRGQVKRGKKRAQYIGLDVNMRSNSALQRVAIFRSITLIWWLCTAFFIVQIAGWLLSIVGLGAEALGESLRLSELARLLSNTIADGVEVVEENFEALTSIRPSLARLIPGLTIFYIGWLLAALAGIFTLLLALSIFILNGVRCFDTIGKLIWFAVAIGGYLAPVVNFFPFVILWVSVVFISAKKSASDTSVTWYANSEYETPKKAANTNRAPRASRYRRAA